MSATMRRSEGLLTSLLRMLGLLVLLCGIVVGYLSARRLPDALPADTPPEIIHIVDFQDEAPRSTYLHVRGGHGLPFAALSFSQEDDPARLFSLVPLVDERHPLKEQMESRAAEVVEGDDASLARWQQYVSGKLDYSQVRLLLLTTDTEGWHTEPSASVLLESTEGVVRPAATALDADIVLALSEHFADVPTDELMVLYESELPPQEEALRLLLLLAALASLLGLATVVATLVTRRRQWR